MKTQTDITQEKVTTPIQRVQHEASDGGIAQLVDNRESTTIQRKLQDSMSAATENNTNPIQRKNNTGLPDNLKTGIENLSGFSMDDVKVHYNSSKPAQLHAHAYAQGTDIHLASGQEKHLPHEAWHVVQQKQGRVKSTMQFKGKVNINDDSELEKEADVMGLKASQNVKANETKRIKSSIEQMGIRNTEKLNGKIVAQRVLAPPFVDPLFQQTLTLQVNRTNERHNFTLQNLQQGVNNLTQADLITMYNNAIQYIGNSAIGANILGIINGYGGNVTVSMGENLPTQTQYPMVAGLLPGQNPNITVNWNPLISLFVWNEDYQREQRRPRLGRDVGLMSSAAVLLHELGHVAQIIENIMAIGTIQNQPNANPANDLYGDFSFEPNFGNVQHMRILEHHDMALYEHPFARQNREPIRDRYENAYAEFGDAAPNFANIPQPIVDLIRPAMAARRRVLARGGRQAWINAVTQHTQNPMAFRQDRNLTQNNYMGGAQGITRTLGGPVIYEVAQRFVDEAIRRYVNQAQDINGNALTWLDTRATWVSGIIGNLTVQQRNRLQNNMQRLINILNQFQPPNWKHLRAQNIINIIGQW